jgi:O-antigen ligase
LPRIVNNDIELKSQMTKLLILILILKIVLAVVVGIACGALILRFIFEVGATQTSTNSRSQQWPGKSNKKGWLAGRAA